MGSGHAMSETYIESSLTDQDQAFEIPLRPQKLEEFVGQENLKARLELVLKAAKTRGEALGHLLFFGPPGLGKTTLGSILAHNMDSKLITTSGPALEKPGDLAGILTKLEKGDVLFIDEIHRLNKTIEEYLYSAMEDFSLDLIIDAGPHARSVQVTLKPFTLIGATTRFGLISSPMRSRFSHSFRLDYYSDEDLQQIIKRTSSLLKYEIDDSAAMDIAKRSRGTPRIANNLLRWVRDYAQVHKRKKIDSQSALDALSMLSIDEMGLDEMDKKILSIIIDHHKGGPVGMSTIAIGIGEEASTLTEVYEPYLIMKGLIKRTPRGREVTQLAYQHLGRKTS